MSMLAERKIKQKWSLNPRGKDWSEDSNKFGQKMLERMGWSKGKGLGAKENGIVEHVKVSYKNDSKGMGYKERNDQWTEHDSNFNALLQSLSGEPPEQDPKLSSLEQKSQSSKVRVHYRKFTRGKDLSRYSEKDLANIFGKKSLKEIKNEEKAEPEMKDDGFSHNGGSMVDYFKKKLPQFGVKNGYAVGSNGVLKNESESEEERVGFGFDRKRKMDEEGSGGGKKMKIEEKEDEEKGLSNGGFDPFYLEKVEVQKHALNTIREENEDEGEENEDEVSVKKKKKKKNKAKLDQIEELIDEESSQEVKNGISAEDQSRGDVTNDAEVKKKKKKKAVSSEMESTNVCDNEERCSGIDNPSLDKFEGKKKKKRKNEDFSSGIDNPSLILNGGNDSSNNEFEVKREKKKKNEEFSSGIDNPSLTLNGGNDSSNYDFEIKRKKKQKNEEISSGIDNPCLTLNGGNDSSNEFEVKRKKKQESEETVEVKTKKKKKNEESSVGIDNPNLNLTDDGNVSQNNLYEVKRKKKKGEDSLALDNPNFNSSIEDQSTYVDNTFEVKRKKKKSEDSLLALDNPTFNSSNEDQNSYVDGKFEVKRKKKKIEAAETNEESMKEPEPSFDLMLNVTSTPTATQPPSSKKRRKSVRFSHVNEERIIPNQDQEYRNELFDINSQIIANGLKDDSVTNIEELEKKIEGFQAEIENDLNEAKVVRYIGEVGNPDGENEKLPGGTKLKFRFANFGRSPAWANKSTSRAKSSYKHLIKGDVVLAFRNTNLHEIVGYGVKK